MIDLSKIIEDAQAESVQSIFDHSTYDQKDSLQSEVNVYQALMTYSVTLLKSYHEALRKELSEHGIDI
jgi:hypothetical protein